VEKAKDSTVSQTGFSPLKTSINDVPPGWATKLRKGWERESLTNSWQHSLLTAVAVVICLLLVRFLPLKEGYWAAISTVVVMQSDVWPTVTAGRDRFFGTAIGAVIGWLTAIIWHGHLLIFGLAVAVSLMACSALGLKSAGRLVGATICLMVLVPGDRPKWRMALDRFTEVSLGILTAVTISLLQYHWARRHAFLGRGTHDAGRH
jgi:uncharacterized membrane protein YgaE (UPF0421/DUF939 family)